MGALNAVASARENSALLTPISVFRMAPVSGVMETNDGLVINEEHTHFALRCFA